MSDQKPSILVDLAYLKAALRIAAKEDIRYFLNGVCIHADATQTTLVATNGHMMIILRKPTENRLTEETTVIIPRDIIENILRLSSKKITLPLELLQEDDTTWSAPLTSISLDSRTRIQFKRIEANFPNWHKVVPKALSGEAGQYSAKLLRAMQSASADIGAPFPPLLQNGPTGAGVMVMALDCLGIIMPMIDKRAIAPADWKRPGWLDPQEDAAQEPAEAEATA